MVQMISQNKRSNQINIIQAQDIFTFFNFFATLMLTFSKDQTLGPSKGMGNMIEHLFNKDLFKITQNDSRGQRGV